MGVEVLPLTQGVRQDKVLLGRDLKAVQEAAI